MRSLPVSLSQTQPLQSGVEQIVCADLERLELLLPEAAHLVTPDLQEYALLYAARYAGDVLHLEDAWDLLIAAQKQAWQLEKDEVVVRLTEALAYPAGRRDDLAEAEQALQRGLEACRRSGDTHRLAFFLSRQGTLALARGKYYEGEQFWSSGLQLAESSGAAPLSWMPLATFIYSADILGTYSAACQFADLVQRARGENDVESLAAALFIRGFFERVIHNLERASEDYRACLHLLLTATTGTPLLPTQQLFSLVVQAELARVRGEYERAQACTETALALAQLYGDHYTLGTLLLDQIIFTYHQHQFTDTYTTFLRFRELAQRVETPHFHERCAFFEQHLEPRELPQPLPARTHAAAHYPPTEPLFEPLSARECEVLQLVAEGLSNCALAQRLVITPGTAKKHLEHIYAKLDVHSRTSAVARARALHLIS